MNDLPKPDDVKYPWQSKTILANAVVGLASLFPPASSWISANPEAFTFGMGVLNMVLRCLSEKKISLSWPL